VSLAHFGACLGRAGVPIDCVIPHCVRWWEGHFMVITFCLILSR
jgi:hypothetical protein